MRLLSKDGVPLYIEDFKIYHTYGGVYALSEAGLLEFNSRYLKRIRVEKHGPVSAKVKLINDEFMCFEGRLPQITCYAYITSEWVLNLDDFGSHLNVVWLLDIDINKPMIELFHKIQTELVWKGESEGYWP
ncbi:hypothetical protein ACV07N_15670 [Roseivirga echinicomitans]